jgi:hypothetical protein
LNAIWGGAIPAGGNGESRKGSAMNDIVEARLVRIHIDREVFDSPNPTTGEALYKLGHVEGHRDLFREVGGDKEDELIPREGTVIQIKEDAHFYSQKAVTLLVNGEAHEVVETRISFDEVVKLAFPTPPPGQCIEFTVTYRHGPPANPKGSLTVGHSVKIKNKMIFDVTPTDRS